jgi:hypothetical protein
MNAIIKISLPWRHTALLLCALLGLTFGTSALAASGNGRNGTTLAAYKTIDICDVGDGNWRYSGVIAAWNEGTVDTEGLIITDEIQFKSFSSSGQFVSNDQYKVTSFFPILESITSGTTQTTALTTSYALEAAPLVDSYIRNSAQLTITNHSGSLGTPKGPNPKATYRGQLPPPACDQEISTGCTYTQGYWGSKPGVVWPDGYSREATFYLSGQTWQKVLDTKVSVSQGYYQLAHQYIAAELNMAKKTNPAKPPDGVQDTLDLAEAWLNLNDPSACTAKGSCGDQKDWAAVLDMFNNGLYPGGPPHCSDEGSTDK